MSRRATQPSPSRRRSPDGAGGRAQAIQDHRDEDDLLVRKQVLVTVDRGETRVAILESKAQRTSSRRGGSRRGTSKPTAGDWRVAELYIERRGRRSIVGNVYKGRVDNVL